MLAYCDTLSVVCSVLNLTGLSVERWFVFILVGFIGVVSTTGALAVVTVEGI